MSLIRDKGYAATTTKDIARLAGAIVTPDIFRNVQWELEPDSAHPKYIFLQFGVWDINLMERLGRQILCWVDITVSAYFVMALSIYNMESKFVHKIHVRT